MRENADQKTPNTDTSRSVRVLSVTYPETFQITKMERFSKIVKCLKAVNYFRKTIF